MYIIHLCLSVFITFLTASFHLMKERKGMKLTGADSTARIKIIIAFLSFCVVFNVVAQYL